MKCGKQVLPGYIKHWELTVDLTFITCFNTEIPQEGLYVVIFNEQYRIDICQRIIGKDAIDLTLVKVEDYYDVISE